MFFIPQSIDSVDKLTNASQSELATDELNLAEQYSNLWTKSAELIPPFRAISLPMATTRFNHEYKYAVQHARLLRLVLSFIAIVGFTEILKACQYSVLEKAYAFLTLVDRNIKKHTTSVIAVVCFFFTIKRGLHYVHRVRCRLPYWRSSYLYGR